MQNKVVRPLYTLEASKLRKGDIILTTEKGKISQFIRYVTNGEFSHAMLYLGDFSCVDAGGPGNRITSHNIQRLFFESPKNCTVLRLKQHISYKAMESVVNFARQSVGMEYSATEAARVLLNKTSAAKEPSKQFCSRYVAQSYAEAGVSLSANTDYCSPADIQRSDKLEEVEGHIRLATPLEVEVLSGESALHCAQNKANDYIFSKSTEITGQKIQRFDEFTNILLQNPQYDAVFSEILVKSGFLNLWKLEKEKNAWYYDYEILREKARNSEEIRNVGLTIEYIENEGRNRILSTLCSYGFMFFSFPNSKTLDLLIDLYSKLLELSDIRLKVAATAVQAGGG